MQLNSAFRIVKNHVVFPIKDPEKTRQVFPMAKIAPKNGSYLCAVPHTVEVTRFFRNNGHPLPSPIMSEYNWPGRFRPYSHQIETSEFLVLNKRAYCLSGMGVMKTAAALWAADFLMKKGEISKCLIVSPLSTLDQVWAKEIFQVLPHRRCHILHGSRAKRLELLADPSVDFYIINHDGVKIIESALEKRADINHVVLDECFPAGTKIATPSGARFIETLQLGENVLTSEGVMPITHVFKSHTKRMVRVHFEGGRYVECTPNHPFATNEGWVSAEATGGKTCLSAEGLQKLRDSIRAEGVPVYKEPPTDVLLQGLLHSEYGVPDGVTSMRPLRSRLFPFGGLFTHEPWKILLKKMCYGLPRYRRQHDRESVRGLWQTISGKVCRCAVQTTKVLFKVLCVKVELGEQPNDNGRGNEEGWEEKDREYSLEQRDTHPRRGYSEAQTAYPGGDRHVQEKSRGQRDGENKSRGGVSTVITRRIPAQRSHISGGAYARLSVELQSGLWARREEDSCRGGWFKPRHTKEASAGQEKGGKTLGVRVERVENIELRCPEPVWNLEVAGPHNYIAEGFLVHNCAVMRTSTTARSKCMFRILNRHGIDRSAWGLTGTPTPTSPTDCFGQVKLLTPENYRYGFKTLQSEMMMQINQFKWIPKASAANRANELMQPSIRFALEDCVDLPPTIWHERECDLSPDQKKAYETLKRTSFAEIEGKSVTAVNAAVLFGRLLQTACGCVYSQNHEALEIDFGPRLTALKEVLEECNEKVIIFVPFTGILRSLEDKLKRDYSVAVVDGSVSATKRNKIFKDFQDSKDPHIIIAHPRTMAHGLTLTAASTIVWYSPYPSNEIFSQANARIVRPSQTKTTNIVMLSGSQVEEKIYKTLKERGKLQDLVLELAKGEKSVDIQQAM